MAIYHLEAKMVSRGAGRSAVAAAAYLSCSRMLNEYTGLVFLAQYQSSLRNVLTDSYNSNEIVQLVNQNPIEVTWK